MGNHELESKIKDLRALQALIDEAEAEAETIRDEIKTYMGDTEELRVGEYKITWKQISSSRFDTAALKKAMPDIYSAFIRSTVNRRFVIL